MGKSTTAREIGRGLSLRDKSVLYVDLDPQCNLSYMKKADFYGINTPGAYEVLQGLSSAADAIQGDIIAASPALAGADATITATGKEYRLKEAIEGLPFDYCIIDTPPSLGILTINALTACDGCIVPAQADFLSLQGIGQLHKTIEAVRKYCNPGLTIYGILLTRFSARAIITREVAVMMEEAARNLGTKLYETRIRECTAVKEAQAMQESILDYAPKSNAAQDYMNLIDEMMGE